MQANSGRALRLSMLALAALGLSAQAATRNITITVENLAPSQSIVDAPLHFGFHQGQFDAFNIGQTASAALVSVAELGAGTQWQSAFAAADPLATRGTVGGILAPGQSASLTVAVDTARNSFFSYAAMVVPSNDFFIGNDNPQALKMFDAQGQLQISQLTLHARDVWDAGSEIFDPASAALVGNALLHGDQNSVVAHNFAEFAAFNGLHTALGTNFQSQLSADTPIYRISFSAAAVPEPQSYALMLAGLGALGWIGRRRAQARTAL